MMSACACGIQAFIELEVILYYVYSIYNYVVFTASALTWLTSFNGESWVHGKYKQDGQCMCYVMLWCVRIPIVAMVTQ
jgi:hypothetical protein